MAEGNEDEAKIHKQQRPGREGDPGYPSQDAQALFVEREDTHDLGRTAWRESIAAVCRREGIAMSLHYSWSQEFLEAGKKRLAGDMARQAISNEVKSLRLRRVILRRSWPSRCWRTGFSKKKYDRGWGNQTG